MPDFRCQVYSIIGVPLIYEQILMIETCEVVDSHCLIVILDLNFPFGNTEISDREFRFCFNFQNDHVPNVHKGYYPVAVGHYQESFLVFEQWQHF
jgi:hypothetical protein